MNDRMSVIGREQVVAALEEHLERLIPRDPAMGEEWYADQADEIVEMVLEHLQPQGAVTLTPEELRVTVRAWRVAATMLEALDQDDDARVARALVDRVTAEADRA